MLLCCVSLDCELPESKEGAGFCQCCSVLGGIEASCTISSKAHPNMEENGYT